jgi:hypothetical protein
VTHSTTRRRLVQALAGSLFLSPAPRAAWASDGAVRLLRLPKLALIIGNSKYSRVEGLLNPANDARALAEALVASGFSVDVQLDLGQREMAAAIDAYVKALATRECVGLFYYAGHGLQLNWQNYLVPVDAAIEKVADIPARNIAVGTVIDGMRRAANPMNIIILDACRENPFAAHMRLEQVGLGQMDAPRGTLLAYATAPGNLASDGIGAHGLYSEQLLREMRTPGAKIEDVFKRVRLGVRLASHGRQVPWESTSLEEDFYFNPPEQLRKLSREQEERAFAEERASYEKAREAGEAPALRDYLHRYPSGRFVELAQLQLDEALARQGEKRVEAVPSEGNPFTSGSARGDTNFKVGDRFAYKVSGLRNDKAVFRVTAVRGLEVELNNGRIIVDRLGNLIQAGNGQRFTPRQDFPLEYVVGKRWTTRFESNDASIEIDYRIPAREKVSVAAGTFDCFRLEGKGVSNPSFGGRPGGIALKFWIAPQVRYPIAWEDVYYSNARGGGGDKNARFELTSYRQS